MKFFRKPGDPSPEDVASAKARLAEVMRTLRHQTAVSQPPFAAFVEGPVVRTAYAFLQSMLTQAAAVSRLADTGHAEAAYSNLRSLFELYTDLRYLALGERNERMVKAYQAILYGMYERLRFHGGAAQEAAGLADRIAQVEREFENIAPQLHPEVREAFTRVKLPNHWSFMGRKALCQKIDPQDHERLSDEYRVLSWKAHGLMIAHENVQLVAAGTLFGPSDSPAKSSTVVCTKAADFLEEAWRVIGENGWEPMFFAVFDPPLGTRPPR